MRKPQIYGEIFTPCYMSIDEFERGYKRSDFWTDKNFYEEYTKHLIALGHIANCAKTFILKNYEKVTDWTGLDVIVYSRYHKREEKFYNYTPSNFDKIKTNSTIKRLFVSMDKENESQHNPILTLTDVVLDSIDGDFSLTINGKEFWWIGNEEIIIIANFIENKLNGNSK